ncbi:MAG: excinuclease ABC subunit UvrA [Candidatus Kapabacteria bacterium]|nr:excinuclease ABC subunit UvrA [Candidatus Kapabacteria bacterium]
MRKTNNNKSSKQKYISVKGASLHNLKNISVDIPHNSLTVITGVSGSGKSTLAFDTIYAEGQRRFVESLSAYARQFLERMNKPDVESITGLPPAIAIEQRKQARNPRSTVGTVTEIYDYFRLLYGRIGTTICKKCGKPVKKDTPSSIIEEIKEWEEGTKFYILFNPFEQTKSIDSILKTYLEAGFSRLFVFGLNQIFDIQNDSLPKDINFEELYILVDRLILRSDKDTLTRLSDSLELAFSASGGKITVLNLDDNKLHRYSSKFECADDEIVYDEPEPKLFSFNNPFGACPTCQGFGRTTGIDENLVFPDRSKSIKNGLIHPFRQFSNSNYQRQLLIECERRKIPIDVPMTELDDTIIEFLWEGGGVYPGLNTFFNLLQEKSYKIQNRILLSKYRGFTKCRACNGSRLRTSARQVFVGGKSIPNLIFLPLTEVLEFFKNLELTEYQQKVASKVVEEIIWRTSLLVDIGLEYLTLDRLSHTLSGGESQRINLSTALGSSLVGTLYVLDEPSIGLHPRDTARLLNILFKLRNLGNTIIVVEHDPDIIRSADYIIDLGPHSGENGGQLVFAGEFDKLLTAKNSLTADYITKKKKIEISKTRKPIINKKIIIENPRLHNLKMKKVEIPLNCFVVVTGVSGSGKSTLVHNILYSGLKKYKAGLDQSTNDFDSIKGYFEIDYVELVDQTPIGKSSRSTPVTYTKIYDYIRDLFASTQAAKQFGWKAGYFSFNVPGGRCETCEGDGFVTVNMQFLPDVQLVCDSCKGTRFKKEVLQVKFKEKTIVDVLNMTVDEAVAFFKEIPKISERLKILQDVGLGYLRLGQPSNMLSGGESQRIKLASHLDSSENGHTLFIFDEPTTGLHIDDIAKLLKCFKKLIDNGNSIIIIEHNLYVIASADWIIDLGPEGGEKGGLIVAEGTPEQIAKIKNSFTGQALKQFFEINA